MSRIARVAATAIAIGFMWPSLAQAQTRAQFEQARHKLVDEILVPAGIKNLRVVQAMRDTPRHEFIANPSLRNRAYYDMALPIGGQQTISSPLIVSQMTQALDLQPGDKVLEIGTGSGYQAAVLSPLSRSRRDRAPASTHPTASGLRSTSSSVPASPRASPGGSTSDHPVGS